MLSTSHGDGVRQNRRTAHFRSRADNSYDDARRIPRGELSLPSGFDEIFKLGRLEVH
jgi:hypothetical protein